MLNFDFCLSTDFVFGKGAEDQLVSKLQEFGAHKVLVHYGQGSVVRSGLLPKVLDHMTKANIPYVELGGVQPNPVDTMVYKGIELARKEQVDFILAVGGGSAIDSAKAIAVGVPYDGDFWELFQTGKRVDKALPLATILTLPATGSEASPNTVITKEEGKWKMGYGSQLLRPKFSLMNPELTFSLPPFQTACGISDMCAHILERYLSPTPDVGLTDRLCEATLQAIIAYAPRVMNQPEDYEARANIMWAGTMAHCDLLGLDRLQDWSSHAIEHELSARYDVAHGAGLAVVFPAFMRFTMPQHVMRFAQLGNRVFGLEMDFEHPEVTATKAIDAYEAFMASLDLPTDLVSLGAKVEDIPAMADHVVIKGKDRLGNFQPLSREDIRKIYELMVKD